MSLKGLACCKVRSKHNLFYKLLRHTSYQWRILMSLRGGTTWQSQTHIVNKRFLYRSCFTHRNDRNTFSLRGLAYCEVRSKHNLIYRLLCHASSQWRILLSLRGTKQSQTHTVNNRFLYRSYFTNRNDSNYLSFRPCGEIYKHSFFFSLLKKEPKKSRLQLSTV